MFNPKGILFDLDGTLVDTSRDISANINRAFESLGFPQLSHEAILSHVGYGARYLVQECLRITRPDVEVDEKLVTRIWELFREHYREHLIDFAQPYEGVRNFLENSARPMGVISNKPEEFVKGVLRELDLIQHFKFSWGKDTLPVFKPDPQVIRYGIHELGIEAADQVCMLGDNQVDIIAAKGAGAISIALSYGFTPAFKLEAENPHHLFHSFAAFAEACP